MTQSPLSATISLTEREQLLLGSRLGYAAGVTRHPDKLSALAAATELFALLGVDYASIGGLAVAIRSGVPRATLDINFAIPTLVGKLELVERMAEHGFQLTGQFAHSINFEHESGEPVQLAFDVAFDPMVARAERIDFSDLFVCVVTKSDLIAMKRLAAADPRRRRSKALRDQADIALLEGDVPDANEGW